MRAVRASWRSVAPSPHPARCRCAPAPLPSSGLSAPASRPDRQSITFELVARLAPHQGPTANLVRTFGLEPVDYDGIRDATKEHMANAAKVFGTALNEEVLQIHLQKNLSNGINP
jgi:hypothetical protein